MLISLDFLLYLSRISVRVLPECDRQRKHVIDHSYCSHCRFVQMRIAFFGIAC